MMKALAMALGCALLATTAQAQEYPNPPSNFQGQNPYLMKQFGPGFRNQQQANPNPYDNQFNNQPRYDRNLDGSQPFNKGWDQDQQDGN